MNKLVYLLLALAFALPSLLMASYRKDLARKAALFASGGAITGAVAELFYFYDYWRPPSLLGVAAISPEDFIAGAGIVAFSFLVFPVMCGYAFGERSHPRHRKLYGGFFLAGISAMCTGVFYAHANSVLVGAGILLALTTLMALLRQDLWRPMLVSGVLMTAYACAIYTMLFGLIAPDFWARYWLLSHTNLGITVGAMPLTELVWYLSWSLFASISYPFVSGRELVRYKELAHGC